MGGATSGFIEYLAKSEQKYHMLLGCGETEQAERQKQAIEEALHERLPLLMQEITIAIYGTGRISACLLSFLERFAGDRKAALVFLHTDKQTGRKFRGYPIFNIRDISKADPDHIVIASITSEASIRRELQLAGTENIPQESVPKEILLLLDNYEQHDGRIHEPPAVTAVSGTFEKNTRPFYIRGTEWPSQDLLSSFPKIREKVLGVIKTDSSASQILGIPVLRELPSGTETGENDIRCLSDALLEYLKTQETTEYHPVSVRIDSSTICQLNCSGCYMRLSDSGTVGRGFLRADRLIRFLDMNPGILEVELSNSGEPFLNPQLGEILEILHERSIRIQFWNGVNLNDVSDEILETLVRCEVETIVVSIDGVTQEVYEQYRRGGSIEKVYANIRKINEWKRQCHTNHPDLRWQFILMNHNQHEAAAAVKKAEELGMTIQFKPDWSGSFVPEDPERLFAVTGSTHLNQNEFAIKRGYQYLSDTICAQMILSPQINWDGRLLGCCNAYQQDWGFNAFETPLSELFNNANYRAAVVSLLSGHDGMDHTGPCRECFTYRENVMNNMVPLMIP